jgi:hypothetical protein
MNYIKLQKKAFSTISFHSFCLSFCLEKYTLIVNFTLEKTTVKQYLINCKVTIAIKLNSTSIRIINELYLSWKSFFLY